MKIAIFDPVNFEKYYANLAKDLCVDCVLQQNELNNYDVIYSRYAIPDKLRNNKQCFAGYFPLDSGTIRSNSMSLAKNIGMPTMEWGICANKDDVFGLFDKWRTDYIIFKEDNSHNCNKIIFFKKNELEKLNINYNNGIFCEPVNMNNGDIYKIEGFDGEIILSYLIECSSINDIDKNIITGKDLNHRKNKTRKFFDPSDTISNACKQFFSNMTKLGYGYISLDLMKDENGNFKLIEYNQTDVAMWWTTQFEAYTKKYKFVLSSFFDRLKNGP
ncbi:MAG: hypothetical protein Q7R95_09700 [bacterium]|nr:hypothetical protein [bacterium]